MPGGVRNLRDGKILIKDGTGTPNVLEIPVSKGDLNFTVHRPTVITKDRGKLYSRRDGDEMEVDVTFSFALQQYSYASGASTGVSVADALYRQGGAAAWVSTDDACNAHSVDLVFEIQDPCVDGAKEILTFIKFHADQLAVKEGDDADEVTVTGKAFTTNPVRTYSTGP